MSENKTTGVSRVKEYIGLIREVLVVLIVLAIFLLPDQINSTLNHIGITEFDFLGLKAKIEKEANLETLTELENFKELNSEYQSAIDSLIEQLGACDSNSEVSNYLDSLQGSFNKSNLMIEAKSQMLASQIETQQTILERKYKAPVEKSGWLFVGKISEDKSKWLADSPRNIKPIAANISDIKALELVTKNEVYLREEGSPLERNQAPIKAVIPSNTKLEVKDIEFSHAKGGGWFVWVKVVGKL